jgi:ectoine hydroxylase-related dioxygenase (phytanoyl-CoA dioxygenase family)
MNLADQYIEHGWVKVEQVVPAGKTAELRRICDNVTNQFLNLNPETGKPGDPDGHVMRHLENPCYFADARQDRLTLLETVAMPEIIDIITGILGEAPLFRTTSFWYNPVNQHLNGNWHRDAQFIYPDEEEEKAVVLGAQPQRGMQLMLALVDTEDNEYVPGSHSRWDTEKEYEIRKGSEMANCTRDDMPGARRFRQAPGDILTFNAYGLHRGRYHADKLRRTMMFSYTIHDAAREDTFTDTPWFLEPGFLDGLSDPARAFYQTYVDRFREFWLRQSD